MYDVIIIGGGPAAIGAAVYVARKKLKTVLVAPDFGGQSSVSADVQNWIGEISLSGFDLAEKLEKHLRAQSGIEIVSPERVTSVREIPGGFSLTTESGKTFEAKAVIVASGSRRRRLEIPGEAKFEGKGVVFCSTCDAPLFGDKTVAVVGGGNAALEAVVDLIPYAKKIYLLVRSGIKADQVTQEHVRASSKVEIIMGAVPEEVLGGDYVTGLRYRNAAGVSESLSLDGVFVEIGAVPNSEIVKGLVEMNAAGEVIIDHRTAATSKPGVFAAGDVTDEVYKQNNISVGDAVKAALSAYNYLLGLKRKSPATEPSAV